jgi:hypothetical protein
MVQGEKQVQPVSRQSRAFRTTNKFNLEVVPMAKHLKRVPMNVLPVERSSKQSRMSSIKVGLGSTYAHT